MTRIVLSTSFECRQVNDSAATLRKCDTTYTTIIINFKAMCWLNSKYLTFYTRSKPLRSLRCTDLGHYWALFKSIVCYNKYTRLYITMALMGISRHWYIISISDLPRFYTYTEYLFYIKYWLLMLPMLEIKLEICKLILSLYILIMSELQFSHMRYCFHLS